tara:strand:- start:78 stop:779 length:702 start_codon:yes stop_codon:yes gene_type:complete
MKIKSGIQLIIITSIIFVVFGCEGKDGLSGEDGADGRAAIAYSWMGNIWSVSTTDPTIPSTFINGMYYYYASVGTYYYSYSGDGGSWSGYYTIWITEGDPGQSGEPGDYFWQDGADGADGVDGVDMCFELMMYSYIGPSFYDWYCSYENISLPRTTSNPNEENNDRYEIDLRNEMRNYDNENQIITKDNLVKSNYHNFDESDYINSIDEHPNSVTESGKIGKFHFIHKYVKVE